jgi:hypothetical protein
MSEPLKIDDVPAEELVRIARDNHVWLNAFSCIRPSPEFLQSIGQIVLDKLEVTDLRDGLGISPMVILTVNKS